MTRIVFAAFCLFLALLPSHFQAQKNITSEQTIKRLEQQLEAALSKNDTAALDRLLANDFIEINTQGDVVTKGDLLAHARAQSSRPSVKSVGPEKKVDELTIRIHGDTALVAGRTTIRYQFMEYQKTTPAVTHFQSPVTVDQERFIRAYSLLGGRWQLVAWQTTSVAKR